MAENIGASSSGSNNTTPVGKYESTDEPNRIGFLNQCKLELSAEVIKWKEENHKLRREKESYERKVGELQSAMEEINKRNKDLEASLFLSNQEYEKIKMHSLAINEENRVLHRKLSKTAAKYYSYPWSELGGSPPVFPFSNGGVHHISKTESSTAGSWEEVSQKLLEQMKLEMKELQELGHRLAINELPSNSGDCLITGSLKENTKVGQSSELGEVATDVVNLTQDMELLKQCLRNQHQKLSVLLNQSSFGSKNSSGHDSLADFNQNSISGIRTANSVYSLADWETSDATERKFTRPSDESFRAYFTQQLNNSKSTEELKRMMKFYLDDSKGFLDQGCDQSGSHKTKKTTTLGQQMQNKDGCKAGFQTTRQHNFHAACTDGALIKPVTNNPPNATKNCLVEEERVCPICEVVFPRVFPQKEFESHVVAHLEAESVSLLNQYEIL